MPNKPVTYEVLIEQYLRSILDIRFGPGALFLSFVQLFSRRAARYSCESLGELLPGPLCMARVLPDSGLNDSGSNLTQVARCTKEYQGVLGIRQLRRTLSRNIREGLASHTGEAVITLKRIDCYFA